MSSRRIHASLAKARFPTVLSDIVVSYVDGFCDITDLEKFKKISREKYRIPLRERDYSIRTRYPHTPNNICIDINGQTFVRRGLETRRDIYVLK